MVLVLSALLLSGPPAAAGEPLSAEAVRELVAGKTHVLHFPKAGATYRLYYAEDGTGHSLRPQGRRGTGAWRIDEQGRHCTRWGRQGESCAAILPAGDGRYERVLDGEVQAVWETILDGDPFGLAR